MLIILISWSFKLLKIILTIFSLRTDFTFNYFNFLHRLLISILIKEIIIKVYNLLNFSILKLFILLFYFDKLLVFSIINKIFLLFFFFYAFCLFFLCLLFLLSFHKYLNRLILFQWTAISYLVHHIQPLFRKILIFIIFFFFIIFLI